MDPSSISSASPPPSDLDELRRYLDNYDPEAPDKEQLVLFRDKDGKVHMIGKKINRFEGLWAKLGLSSRFLRGFGMADANFKHVLAYLNDKKLSDPRLKKVVDRYNEKRRKSKKIQEEDFPNLFDEY
jgi:hypothetical protein